MAQLADGALLDLAHALACHLEPPPDLFERVVVVVEQAEAQLDHLALALGQRAQRPPHLFAQHLAVGRALRPLGALIFDQVGERVLLLFGERRIEREDLLGPDQQLASRARR